MAGTPLERQLYWDDRGVIINPKLRIQHYSKGGDPWGRAHMNTKKYPWSRVRALRAMRFYPLMHLEASDPNRAVQNILIGPKGVNPRANKTMERFVKFAEARGTVQIPEVGWWGAPALKWEAVQGFPGEVSRAARNVYREAQAPNEKVIERYERQRTPSWIERIFGLGKRLYLDYGAIRDPDAVALTESFVYARVRDKAFRIRRASYSGRVRVVYGPNAIPHGERFYFGRSAHIGLDLAGREPVLTLAEWLDDGSEPELIHL